MNGIDLCFSSYMDEMQRQLGLWGENGQEKLQSACVAVAGLGGIGAVSALMLVKAGIGTVRVCDNDRYETPNIVEQMFASHATVGACKVEASVSELSKHTRIGVVEGFAGDLRNANDCARLLEGASLVVSAVDNPQARIALGQAAEKRGIPFIVSANIGWTVIHTVYMPGANSYKSMWKDHSGLAYLDSGYPNMDDSATASAVKENWNIWVAAVSGFQPESMRKFLAEEVDFYWYSSPPAFFAGALGINDALKILTGVKEVYEYPKLFIFDMKANRNWDWMTLGKRYAALKEAWPEGEAKIMEVIESWDRDRNLAG